MKHNSPEPGLALKLIAILLLLLGVWLLGLLASVATDQFFKWYL